MRRENSDPLAQTVAFATLAGIFSLIISLYKGFHFPSVTLFPNFLLLTILLTVSPLLKFKAYQTTEASEVGVLSASQGLWTVLASFLFLGEIPTVFKILGTLCIILGVSVASWRKHRLKFNKGEIYALLAALGYGFCYVNAFYILRSYDAASLEVFGNFLPTLVILIVYPKVVKKMRFYYRPINLMGVSFASLFDALAAISLYIAYQYGRNASQISPLSSTSLLVTVILAAIFLRERNNLAKKSIGAIIAFIGTVLLLR